MAEPVRYDHHTEPTRLDRPRVGRPIEVSASEPPAVRTERLTLRRLLPSDREAFIDAVRASLDHLANWTPLHEPGESDDAFFDRQLAAMQRGDADGSAWRRVAFNAEGTLIGVFNLNAITRGLEWQADASWWIHAEHTRRGYASEGIGAMLRHAFEPLPAGLGLLAVHCGIDPANEASRRCAEACGFVHDPGQRSYLRMGDRWAIHEFYIARPG